MREIFEKLNKETLIDFLVEYAERDIKFANAVLLQFGQPESAQELKKMKNMIDKELCGVSDYDRHDSWGYVHLDTTDIFEEIRQRIEQGHIQLAFAEIEMFYLKLLENFEYQGECEISDEAEDCLEVMSEIADKAVSDEEKAYIYERCIALSERDEGRDYGADYEPELLKIAAKFVTTQNRLEFEQSRRAFS